MRFRRGALLRTKQTEIQVVLGTAGDKGGFPQTARVASPDINGEFAALQSQRLAGIEPTAAQYCYSRVWRCPRTVRQNVEFAMFERAMVNERRPRAVSSGSQIPSCHSLVQERFPPRILCRRRTGLRLFQNFQPDILELHGRLT